MCKNVTLGLAIPIISYILYWTFPYNSFSAGDLCPPVFLLKLPSYVDFGKFYSFQAFGGKKFVWMNKSANGLLSVSINLDGLVFGELQPFYQICQTYPLPNFPAIRYLVSEFLNHIYSLKTV